MAMQRVAAEAVEGISVHDIATSTSGGETEGSRGLPRRLAARSRGGSGQTRRLWQHNRSVLHTFKTCTIQCKCIRMQ
ncbi:hypothetical protein DAI22_08g069800 [Oryza sativa Japonica Group]|nr:hypothetical protein DAI22_08g069800 [Oryza sativa Japonica Group]KAF2918613.1 hypothetical protein DAI22_08g069800 [Oryza sativa Japonica Group]